MGSTEDTSEKFIIHVDSELKELIPGYLKNREKDIIAFKESLQKDDYESITMLGHSMKGSGGGYGFDGLSEIGYTIEKAGMGKDESTIRKSIEELTHFLDNVKVIYDD